MAGRSKFLSQNKGLPAQHAFAITPDDNIDLAESTRGLYVGTAGNVTCITADGDTVVFKNLAAGVVHAISVSRVKSTGTGALDIVGVV